MVELNNLSKWDYPRFVFSFLLLTFATVITFYAIFTGNTTFYDAVPPVAAFCIFLVNLILLGIMEGLQIALVELKRQHPDSYKNTHPRAYDLGERASHKDNVERFLMGRQVFVIFIVFFISKITTVYLETLEEFLFPVSKLFYHIFLETGFLTCIMVVIVGQLMPQILASKYPVHFLDLWVMKYAYMSCLAVEVSGITHACWLLSHAMGKLAGISADDVEAVGSLDKDLDQMFCHNSDSSSRLIVDDEIGCTDKQQPMVCQHAYMEQHHNIITILKNEVNPDIRRILAQYLNSHPEKFYSFPSVIGNKIYPSPNDLANACKNADLPIPDFLRDISDPKHVPPHVVAWELLLTINDLQKKILCDKTNSQNHIVAF